MRSKNGVVAGLLRITKGAMKDKKGILHFMSYERILGKDNISMKRLKINGKCTENSRINKFC